MVGERARDSKLPEVVAKERRKERRWLKSGGGLSIN